MCIVCACITRDTCMQRRERKKVQRCAQVNGGETCVLIYRYACVTCLRVRCACSRALVGVAGGGRPTVHALRVLALSRRQGGPIVLAL